MCLNGLISKDLPRNDKLKLIEELQLVHLISGIDLTLMNPITSDLLKHIAVLTSTLGNELLECNSIN